MNGYWEYARTQLQNWQQDQNVFSRTSINAQPAANIPGASTRSDFRYHKQYHEERCTMQCMCIILLLRRNYAPLQPPLIIAGRWKFVIIVVGCVAAWYMGKLLANSMIDGSLQRALSAIQELALKATITAPFPKQHKCAHWTRCPAGTFAFLVLSGGAKFRPPQICFEDEMLLSSVKNNVGRGMNIAIVEAKTAKTVDTGNFDLWGGDKSERMIEFVKKAPDGSLILMTTYDDSYTRLTEDAKKYIEELGSRQIRSLTFRGNWVFLGTKGFTLPKNFQREKVLNSQKEGNRYGSWPAEIQIDGCFSPKTDYL
uniref:protein FAM3B-like n=1 Tax=Pristiophorus japonicus TaxID=55135 RepID=UPI00398E97D2